MEIIQKVRKNSSNGQKIITIPKDCDINIGDYVRVFKVELPPIK